jgi:glycerophosphoryl diester phosphodiesterase
VPQLSLQELRDHYGYKRSFLFLFKKRVPARIPTLPEFIAWADSQPTLQWVILDLKVPEGDATSARRLGQVIADTLHAAKSRFRTIVLSPHAGVIDAVRGILPSTLLALDVPLPPGIVVDPEEFSAVSKAIAAGNGCASAGRPVLNLAPWPAFRAVIEHDVYARSRHNAGHPAIPIDALVGWTVNDKEEMAELVRMGVSGLITDRAIRLRIVALAAGKIIDRVSPEP